MKYLQGSLMEQKEHQHNSRCQSVKVFLEKGKAQSIHIRGVLIIIPPHNDCAVTAKNYSKVLKMIIAKKYKKRRCKADQHLLSGQVLSHQLPTSVR